MRARSFQGPVVLAGSVVAGLLVAWGCGDDEGRTPKCTELPLYDVHDASPQDIAARLASADNERCVTKPGTATTAAAGAPGGGGSSGSGGSASAGGGSSGGSGGTGGASDAAAD